MRILELEVLANDEHGAKVRTCERENGVRVRELCIGPWPASSIVHSLAVLRDTITCDVIAAL